MLATQKRPAWQYLNQVAGGRVLITPKEGEPFGLSIDDVVAACRSQENIALFTEQVRDLLDRVSKWLGEAPRRSTKLTLDWNLTALWLLLFVRTKGSTPTLRPLYPNWTCPLRTTPLST